MKDEIIKMLELHIKVNEDLLTKNQQKVLDYITNLQEEINKLTSESTEWEERTYCWQDRAEDLEIKIDKAIKYINTCTWSNGTDEEIQYSLHVPTLLNILKGEENED